MTIEKPEEKHDPLPNNGPVQVGENVRDRTCPEHWHDPAEGAELIPPQAEGQR